MDARKVVKGRRHSHKMEHDLLTPKFPVATKACPKGERQLHFEVTRCEDCD